MNRKSVILLIGFLALISDAWILDLERAQRTIEEIDRVETTAKGNGYGTLRCQINECTRLFQMKQYGCYFEQIS